MSAYFVAMQGIGAVLAVVAVAWAWRTRHERRVWRRTRHDTATVAIVLELEEKVRELDRMSVPVDTR